jgi:catechol 2,3-dioxygenase-like lactoylglutathione lyase family enzyme
MNATAVRIKGIDLSGYMVKDAARAIAFYRDVFGLEPSRIYPDNRGAEYDLPDGTTFGLWGGGEKFMPFQPSTACCLQSTICAQTSRRSERAASNR